MSRRVPHPERAGKGRWIAGVDIGGTTIAAGLVSTTGGPVRALAVAATPRERAGGEIVRKVCAMVREAVADGGEEVAGVGVGTPGALDRERGSVLEAHNLGWFGVPLRDQVETGAGLSAVVENDADCAAYGEWWQGAGKGYRLVIGVTVGTGIGGGIVAGGRLRHGAGGVAGEVGHITVEYGGRRCTCGARGCLEAYASGPAIARSAVRGLDAGARSLLSEMVGGQHARITAATVSEAAVRGDSYAAGVLEAAARRLAAGISTVVNVVSPDAVVVMGGVTAAGAHFFDPLADELRRPRFRAALDACTVRAGVLPAAGVVGAAGVFFLGRREGTPKASSYTRAEGSADPW